MVQAHTGRRDWSLKGTPHTLDISQPSGFPPDLHSGSAFNAATDWPSAVLDVRAMEEADQITAEAGSSDISMMANAGRAVADEVVSRWSARPTVVLCGPGQDGGEGFVVASLLEAAGWPVRLARLGPDTSDASQYHSQAWAGKVEELTPQFLDGAELVVDALYGAGLSRPLEGMARETLATAARKGLPIVAIDVPSGLVGDTGESLGAVSSVLTVTFFRKKPAHLLLPGKALCGEVVVKDIGTSELILQKMVPHTFENHPRLWLRHLPRPRWEDDKYQRGYALISGGYPLTGAAKLAARAADRAGAGLITVAVPEVAFPIYAAAFTSIMVQSLAEPGQFAGLLADPRISAVLIGPGASPGQETRERVLACLASGRPLVLDAGALTAFCEDPSTLDRAIVGPCILTPHEGEFQRLFAAEGCKLDRARAAAGRSLAVVILKGSDTVIAAPDGRVIINTNAPAGLATAGAGDVLSGFLVGLMAQGMKPFWAAAAAVWLHGAAASEFGPGLIADDLPEILPRVLSRLLD